MKQYVEGYVLPVQKKKLKEYRKVAQQAGKIWMKHGALRYVECVGEDMKIAKKWGCLPFPKMAKAKSNETVIFAFIIYKSRTHRDKVNKKIMEDPAMQDPDWEKKMPFEIKRMAAAGFETIVNL